MLRGCPAPSLSKGFCESKRILQVWCRCSMARLSSVFSLYDLFDHARIPVSVLHLPGLSLMRCMRAKLRSLPAQCQQASRRPSDEHLSSFPPKAKVFQNAKAGTRLKMNVLVTAHASARRWAFQLMVLLRVFRPLLFNLLPLNWPSLHP